MLGSIFFHQNIVVENNPPSQFLKEKRRSAKSDVLRFISRHRKNYKPCDITVVCVAASLLQQCYWLRKQKQDEAEQNTAQQMKRTNQKSKKHLSLQIFWSIARAVLFSYLSYCVRQSKKYFRRYLIVI